MSYEGFETTSRFRFICLTLIELFLQVAFYLAVASPDDVFRCSLAYRSYLKKRKLGVDKNTQVKVCYPLLSIGQRKIIGFRSNFFEKDERWMTVYKRSWNSLALARS
jgi:hypothetical protein